jgi:hypothetical protein
MKTIINAFMILMLAGVLIISSCTKPANTNPGGGSTGLLKTMTQVVTTGGVTDTTITTLAYDNQNRVVSQIAVTKLHGTLVGQDTTTYTFGTNSVIQYSSASQANITYTLNSWGFKQSDNLGDSWVYNSNGYLIQANRSVVGDTIIYAYNSLNQLQSETYSSGNTYTFTYPSNPIGKAGSSWSQGQSTGDLFSTDIEYQNGTITTLTATYVVNGQGVLTQSTITSSGGGSSPVITYFAYY